MNESVAAQQVWRYLQTMGCTRTTGTTHLFDPPVHFVEIHRAGALIASAEHTELTLANSGALLAAMRHLAPPVPVWKPQAMHQRHP